MISYIIRRVLLMIPALFLVTVVIFGSVRFIPGSTVDLMLQGMESSSGVSSNITKAEIKHALGLDVPIQVQYIRWIGSALHGDLGRSLWRNEEVTADIREKFPITVELAIPAIIIALLIAIPASVYSAIWQDTMRDYIVRSIAIFAICVPGFWLGTMVVVYPSIWWGWSPPINVIPFLQNPIGNLKQFLLPAVILGMVMSGVTMRMTRTMMLEVLRQDYIRTAWSKGLRQRAVIFNHALKNALLPVITVVGLQVPVLIGGSVIMEQIFSLPGVGQLMLKALTERDYPIISGITLVLAIIVLFINLIVDLIYIYLDPRIHYT